MARASRVSGEGVLGGELVWPVLIWVLLWRRAVRTSFLIDQPVPSSVE